MIRPARRWILDRLILRPTRDVIEPSDNSVRVRLRAGRWDLECFVHDCSPDAFEIDALVLKFPGTSGRAERSSSFPAAELGFDRAVVWTWNPPGYGGSGGRASLATIGAAATAFAGEVIRRYSAAGSLPQIYLCGNSLGCCVALHVAAELNAAPEPLAGLILRNPPPLSEVLMRIANRYPLGRWMQSVADVLPPSMDAARSLAGVSAPIVWICCDADRLVPPALQAELMNRHPGITLPVHLAGLDHHESADDQQRVQIAVAIKQLVALAE